MARVSGSSCLAHPDDRAVRRSWKRLIHSGRASDCKRSHRLRLRKKRLKVTGKHCRHSARASGAGFDRSVKASKFVHSKYRICRRTRNPFATSRSPCQGLSRWLQQPSNIIIVQHTCASILSRVAEKPIAAGWRWWGIFTMKRKLS